MTRKAKARNEIVRSIKKLRRDGKPLNYSSIRQDNSKLLLSAKEAFGTWAAAIKAAGLDYTKICRIHRWSEKEIRSQLRNLYKQRDFGDISTLIRKHPKLYGACCRHFGSGLSALESVGIDYDQLLEEQTDRWSKSRILEYIKQRHDEGHTLCRAAILRKEPDQKRFCYAATHQFGNWSKALKAAGLSPDKIRNRDGTWPRERVIEEIQKRFKKGKLLNTEAMLREDLTLHAAGRRHFGTWEKAVKSAGVDYNKHVRGGLRGWTRAKTKRALRERITNAPVSSKQFQREMPALYRAAIHHFGSWKEAERVARKKK